MNKVKFEILDDGDYDDTISGVPVGEDWLMSEFLAPNSDALTQTMTIKGKIEEEKKKQFDSTNRTVISEYKKSYSRPITPAKSNSKIPFIDEYYMKSPMRTRSKIPRTPFDQNDADNRNDFQNDDQSQMEHSIVIASDKTKPPSFGGDNETKRPKKSDVEKKQKEGQEENIIFPEAFIKKDLIPRTPPQVKSKKYQNPPPEEAKKKPKKQ
jgi:hypothetical protein